MPRLQILELPEGASDERPPFVLVVDESAPQRVIAGMNRGSVRDYWHEVADRIGARGVIVTAETVEIPANEVSIGPDGYPVRLRVDADLGGFRDQVADALADARRAAAEGGHLFGGPGHNDPIRCSRCGLEQSEWVTRRDVPTCAEVRAVKGGA
jgi:hypothetical protein